MARVKNQNGVVIEMKGRLSSLGLPATYRIEG
jgi:hypothetical protein